MKPIRLMIVDDMYEIREQLGTAIMLASESENIPVEIVGMARNGDEAIQLVDTCKPEVILMDLEMPVLGGLTAADRIKTAHSHICILALTIHDSPATRLAVSQAGMDGLIFKGASIHEILKEVHAHRGKYDSSQKVTKNYTFTMKGK